MVSPIKRQNGSPITETPRGRGAAFNPANRFETISLEVLGDHLDHLATEEHVSRDGKQITTEVYRDASRSVINRVDSPDIPFGWTLNPYRGCEHGCVYCYARPTHENLGFSSGVDFETRIMAKVDAPDLLRKELARASWRGEPIAMSGVTDCYQPIEARLKITRKCLEIMAEARQPVTIVTKSRLILRDIDLLADMARQRLVNVAISVTSLDNALSAKLEPRAASPRDRIWTIRRLASAGIPVMAMVAPIIPAINDREIPAILDAVARVGARAAGYVLLRLPWQNKELLEDWLDRHMPDRKDHVLSLVRQSRDGELYDSRWHARMRGEGEYARQIAQTFRVFATRCGLNQPLPPLNRDQFRRPVLDGQMMLFDSPR
ncbi:MAG: PA0069 family radical SAM protein [Phycisphaera sp.]|nr:PA0069 family radical SAM protein [Phycisphaera sp.]